MQRVEQKNFFLNLVWAFLPPQRLKSIWSAPVPALGIQAVSVMVNMNFHLFLFGQFPLALSDPVT